MSNGTTRRPGSMVGPLILIALGALFLYANFRPELNPWPLVSRYWPLILIFLGLGKLWDHLRLRDRPEAARPTGLSGVAIALLILLALFAFALSRGRGAWRDIHQSESVERRGAESVRVHIKMPAGELKLAGGAHQLLEAAFDYSAAEGKPKVTYDVMGKQAQHGIGESKGQLGFLYNYILIPVLLRNIFADKEVQEAVIKDSMLDWVIVRPAALTNGPRKSVYRHGMNIGHWFFTANISRADVGDFMLKQLTDNTYLRKTPGVSY